jgi:hypothetical protein
MFSWAIAIGVFGLSALAIWRFVKRTEIREKVVYVPPRTPAISMPTFFVVPAPQPPAPQPVEREAPDWEYELVKMYLINEAEDLALQLVDDGQSEPQS